SPGFEGVKPPPRPAPTPGGGGRVTRTGRSAPRTAERPGATGAAPRHILAPLRGDRRTAEPGAAGDVWEVRGVRGRLPSRHAPERPVVRPSLPPSVLCCAGRLTGASGAGRLRVNLRWTMSAYRSRTRRRAARPS